MRKQPTFAGNPHWAKLGQLAKAVAVSRLVRLERAASECEAGSYG